MSNEILPANASTKLKPLCGMEEKMLGAAWNPMDDLLHVVAKIPKIIKHLQTEISSWILPEILTRRMVLSMVSEIYDVVGFTSPFISQAKVQMQKTWTVGRSWDENLPSELKSFWFDFGISTK